MARFLSKGRRRFLLPALLILTALFFPWYRSTHKESRGFARRFLLSLAPPLQRGAAWVVGLPELSMETLREWLALKDAKDRLEKELRSVELERLPQKGQEAELASLKKTLELKPDSARRSHLARLIIQDAGTWNRSFVIDAGQEDGVLEDAPVVSVQGIVGRIWSNASRTARVLTVLDPASSASGIDVRSRVKGVAHGTGRNRMKFEYVNAGSDIEAGDLIVTSGLGGVFPKNIPLGSVVKKTLSGDGLTLDIELAPAVDFGSLEFVFVLEPQSPYNP